MKRVIALLLVFIMLFSIVGCSKDKSPDNNTTTTNNQDNTDINVDVDVNVDINEDTDIDNEYSATDSTTKRVEKNTETTTKKGSSETTTKKAQKPNETTTKKSNVETTTKQAVSTPVTIQKKDFGNGQIVFYPSNIKDSTATYPIIAWANGTGFSYNIYENLLNELAKGGYIVIANTETMSADGTAQLASVDFLINQGKDSSSIFYNKINADKIGLAGHSQGGRSSVNAAATDSRVDCVVSFAGSNFKEEAEKLNAPTFFIGGSADMIVNAKQWLVPAYENCKGPAVYACLKGAIHTRCCTNPMDYSGYALAWLDAWLKNDTNAKSKFSDGGELSQDSAWQDFACKGI